MKRLPFSATLAVLLLVPCAFPQSAATTPSSATSAVSRGGSPAKKAPTPPPITAKPEELAKIKEKTAQIEALVKDLKIKRAEPELVTDVEVYAHAGKMLLEYPDMFGNQAAIERAYTTLDQGIERGKQLQANQPQWNQGKKRIHAYTSEIDGAILPYGVTLPENYDPGKPTRLYVWLHGRSNTMVETEFIHGFLNRKGAGNPPVADQGQIQLDCFGRINGAGWHWAGERDVFESIAAVKSGSTSTTSGLSCAAFRRAAKERGTFHCIIRIASPPLKSGRARSRARRSSDPI
jgi:hypothetical protein